LLRQEIARLRATGSTDQQLTTKLLENHGPIVAAIMNAKTARYIASQTAAIERRMLDLNAALRGHSTCNLLK